LELGFWIWVFETSRFKFQVLRGDCEHRQVRIKYALILYDICDLLKYHNLGAGIDIPLLRD